MMDDIKMCVQKPEIVPRSLVGSCTRSDGTPSISSSHTSSSKQKVVRAKNDVISVADTKKHDSRGANAKLPLKTQVHDSIVQCYAISSNRKSPTTTQESPTGPLRDMSHDLEPSSNSMGLRGSTILIQGKSVSRKRASTNLQMEMFTEEPLDPDGIECASVDYTESEIFEEKIKFPLVADSIEEVDEEMEYLQPPEFSPDSTSEGGKTHTDFN
ncbi:uncharacterized protein [Periplaneta americana]|uniref:uncharacterized protein n=1 Tax=Periplaneta americana TaxID=6978 RepID=UPI0037E8E42B